MIILSSGRIPSKELADKCKEENIALIVVNASAYEVCAILYGLINA
jgi:serine kinase of HPr protein (carbohydrate metabolism regulator)